MKEEAMNET
jgi:hypothetical protein